MSVIVQVLRCSGVQVEEQNNLSLFSASFSISVLPAIFYVMYITVICLLAKVITDQNYGIYTLVYSVIICNHTTN